MKQPVKDVVEAIRIVDLIPVHSGFGGAYYLRNSRGEAVAIVKPIQKVLLGRPLASQFLKGCPSFQRLEIMVPAKISPALIESNICSCP